MRCYTTDHAILDDRAREIIGRTTGKVVPRQYSWRRRKNGRWRWEKNNDGEILVESADVYRDVLEHYSLQNTASEELPIDITEMVKTLLNHIRSKGYYHYPISTCPGDDILCGIVETLINLQKKEYNESRRRFIVVFSSHIERGDTPLEAFDAAFAGWLDQANPSVQ